MHPDFNKIPLSSYAKRLRDFVLLIAFCYIFMWGIVHIGAVCPSVLEHLAINSLYCYVRLAGYATNVSHHVNRRSPRCAGRRHRGVGSRAVGRYVQLCGAGIDFSLPGDLGSRSDSRYFLKGAAGLGERCRKDEAGDGDCRRS